jgi:hypothetical protein
MNTNQVIILLPNREITLTKGQLIKGSFIENDSRIKRIETHGSPFLTGNITVDYEDGTTETYVNVSYLIIIKL